MEMMNRWRAIVGGALLTLVCVGAMVADDYVEDVYYWPDATDTRSADGELSPTYNPRAKEIVFIEDSSSAQHPDTVRAVVRDVPASKQFKQ